MKTRLRRQLAKEHLQSKCFILHAEINVIKANYCKCIRVYFLQLSLNTFPEQHLAANQMKLELGMHD